MQLNEKQVAFATLSFGQMGKLMVNANTASKSAKRAKKTMDHDTIVAHSWNIATIAILGLKDPEYGAEGHRNTDTGPEYRGQLVAAGFSEAKAKLFWEYGQLAMQSEALAGIEDTANKAAEGKEAAAVLKFLQNLDVTKEADLKKIVQPKPEKTFEEKVLELVEKGGMTVAQTATAFQAILDGLEAKAEAAPVTASGSLSSILGAVQQPEAERIAA